MKVCLLNVLHEPGDKRVYHKIASSLVKGGYEILSIGPKAAHLPELKENQPDARGIRFLFIPTALSLPARLLSVFRLWRLGLRQKADIYYAPEPESWVAALGIKLLRGGNVVFDMHEHVPSEFAKFFPRPIQSIMEKITIRFMRLFARKTDLIILTRESFADIWAGLSTPRITVINTNHLQPCCAAVPEELRRPFEGREIIIHQGIFGDVRGSWQLLEAMKLLVKAFPNLCCILLGAYVYGDEADFRSAVEKAGLEKHFAFIPTVPFQEVPAYIALAKVGLILFQPGPRNHTLAMPHKLFDYMREMRPVVAPEFALEVSRIVREADCGRLVDVTHPTAIAEAVADLLKHPEEAARLGANGRRLVEEKYHWEREEAVLLQAFKALEHS